MKVVDIADEIYREIGSPTEVSIASISFWMRANIGTLNNSINTSFEIENGTLEIIHIEENVHIEIGVEESSVLKQMYLVHDYDRKLRSIMGAASWDAILEINDAGTSIRKANKNEIGKTLAQAKEEELLQLNTLINAYKSRLSNPKQVAGDDTIEGGTLNNTIIRNRNEYY